MLTHQEEKELIKKLYSQAKLNSQEAIRALQSIGLSWTEAYLELKSVKALF